MTYEIKNIRLKKVLPDYIATSGFRKREFIVVTDEQHPQLIKFELQNDKCELISAIFPGDTIDIYFNIRGRELIDPTGKSVYFLSFVVWKIKKIENGFVVPTNEKSPHIQHNFNFPPTEDVFGNSNNDDYDDLPF